ncbi:hypothetical protein, partial [Mycobacterium avium]|uniref:hypothetical protein n=1 Tax=Mycobacterium avium TaxID=1764 RepID=UPI00373FDDC1
MIGRALADAGLGRADLDSVEAPRTGPRVGDPADTQAPARLLADPPPHPVSGAPVRTHLGHPAAAAGTPALLTAGPPAT